MALFSKAGSWQWVLRVGYTWHPTGLCRWKLLPPGARPEGESWTAPWAGSQEQRGEFRRGGYPLLQHSPPSLLFCRVFKKASPNGKVRENHGVTSMAGSGGWHVPEPQTQNPAHCCLPQHPARPAGRETEAQWGSKGLSQGQGSSREVLECWFAGDAACGSFGSGSRS